MGMTISRSFWGSTSVKLSFALSFLVLAGCSKTVPPDPVLPPTSTTPSTPSGIIQSFTIADTLVPFNTGSYVKWLVTGTNTLTVVTFNGVKVASYGALDTGPLTQKTSFTLAVNSGAKATVSIKVADSVSTYLWNDGKALKLTKTEYFGSTPEDTTVMWRDSAIDKRIADQLVYFTYTGGSSIVQQTGSMYPSPGNTGPFVVVNQSTQFIWRQVLYTINYLDTKKLIVLFTEQKGSGVMVQWRYTYEFQ